MTNIQDLIDAGALFVINHSGGKDSQAQMIHILRQVPATQCVVIHADLGEVEWHGAKELAAKQAADAGVPFIVAKANYKDGSEKTLLNMVEKRFAEKPGVPSWPSSDCRSCTSDLKRDPIAREFKRYAKAHGFSVVVNCQGIRAAESTERRKKNPFTRNERASCTGRDVFEWYPIFDLTTAEVFATIRDAGQEPHWAYAAGNERLSCVFCIMGKQSDLINGFKHRPELAAKYIALEEKTGYTMHQARKSLRELVGDAIDLAA